MFTLYLMCVTITINFDQVNVNYPFVL